MMKVPTQSTVMPSDFNAAVESPLPPKTHKRPDPQSIRVSDNERKAVERDASGQSINGYVRDGLLEMQSQRGGDAMLQWQMKKLWRMR